MKCRVEDGIMIVDAESESETEDLKAWRALWHTEPKRDKWFQCNYYRPVQVVVI